MADQKLKTASVLAFERKVDPSDALFHAGGWEERDSARSWPPVGIREKSVRGTISNRLNAREQDPAKLNASIQQPNLQRVDIAALPSNADTLNASFTLRVLGGAGTPSACNNAEYQMRLAEVVGEYREHFGFAQLAARYAYNLANGRFLWRNRLVAEQVEVRIRRLKAGEDVAAWRFDALEMPLRSFDAPPEARTDLAALAGAIEEGLLGSGFVLLDVVAYARMGNGQEVYPSQELILDSRNARGDKSKTLYSVDGVAAMHSQKVGNALRTIDTWYPESSDDLGPIAVEPYGSVTSQGKAYRQPSQKADFYTLLDAWILRGLAPEQDQQHYVMANLIRGGVFGERE